MRRNRNGSAVVTLFVLAIICFVISLPGMITLFKPAVDIYDYNNWDSIGEGSHIKTEIQTIYDVFYTETTTTTRYGVETGSYESGAGYLVPRITVENNDSYLEEFVGLFTKSGNIPNQMIEENNDWYYDWINEPADYKDYCKTTLSIDGKFRAMTLEERGLAESYLREIGMTESEISTYLCPYIIEEINSKAIKIEFAIGMILLLIAIILLIAKINNSKKSSTSGFYGNSSTGAYNNSTNYNNNFNNNNNDNSNTWTPYDGTSNTGNSTWTPYDGTSNTGNNTWTPYDGTSNTNNNTWTPYDGTSNTNNNTYGSFGESGSLNNNSDSMFTPYDGGSNNNSYNGTFTPYDGGNNNEGDNNNNLFQ